MQHRLLLGCLTVSLWGSACTEEDVQDRRALTQLGSADADEGDDFDDSFCSCGAVGAPDAGTADPGSADAGAPDAGTDAGSAESDSSIRFVADPPATDLDKLVESLARKGPGEHYGQVIARLPDGTVDVHHVMVRVEPCKDVRVVREVTNHKVKDGMILLKGLNLQAIKDGLSSRLAAAVARPQFAHVGVSVFKCGWRIIRLGIAIGVSLFFEGGAIAGQIAADNLPDPFKALLDPGYDQGTCVATVVYKMGDQVTFLVNGADGGRAVTCMDCYSNIGAKCPGLLLAAGATIPEVDLNRYAALAATAYDNCTGRMGGASSKGPNVQRDTWRGVLARTPPRTNFRDWWKSFNENVVCPFR